MAKPPVLTSTRALYAVVALFILASSTPADAVLGADAASISADHARLSGGQKRPLNMRNPQLQAHEIAMVDGSSIREYVAPNGVVFAVAWSTRFKPDLMSLLGRHAASYAAAASDAMKVPGIKRSVVLQRDDLVVQASSHLNSFVGKAYLRSMVPTGVNIDELR